MQYRILRGKSALAGRLPATQLLHDKALTSMLRHYQSVVLKPRDGRYGRNIVFVTRTGGNTYRMQNERNVVTLNSLHPLLKWLLRKKNKGRRYIVQRRLQLAQIGHRPFDIRIMAQRKKGSSSPWRVTGSYAKVAAQGYLVTNVARRTIPVLEALQAAHIGNRDLLAEAERIALMAAKRLGERYPKLRQVGFDIGIDKRRRIWIIEGNYRPDLRPFRLLKDTSMYHTIMRYKKH
ncbi:YheC/YheD family protein [Paenibacillus sp. PL2-23]|uniref:YheC/YheD family protein n=1 Tax=Paenibacillus sp. PL2-23 TaxID=2100729 RepID=UPI0030F9B976